MTYKENITAILECNFAGFKQEIIDTAVDCIMALSAEPCRTADDYENEIADLHNRLDIAEYDKERYKEEITTLEVKNKGEWIYQQGIVPYKWRCNKCEKMFKTDFNYCPNCGADMRGE